MPAPRTAKQDVADLIDKWLERSGLRPHMAAKRAGFADSEAFRRAYKEEGRALNIDPHLAVGVVRAFTERLTDSERCQAAEAIRFLILTQLPLDRYSKDAQPLFPNGEWQEAMAAYFPEN